MGSEHHRRPQEATPTTSCPSKIYPAPLYAILPLWLFARVSLVELSGSLGFPVLQLEGPPLAF